MAVKLLEMTPFVYFGAPIVVVGASVKIFKKVEFATYWLELAFTPTAVLRLARLAAVRLPPAIPPVNKFTAVVVLVDGVVVSYEYR